jgi:hypothetical protein
MSVAAYAVVPHQQLQLNLLVAHGLMRHMPVYANPLECFHICCVPLLQPALSYCCLQRHL